MLKNVLGFFFGQFFAFWLCHVFTEQHQLPFIYDFLLLCYFTLSADWFSCYLWKNDRKLRDKKKTRKVNLFRCGSEIAEAIYVLGRLSLLFSCVCCCSTEAGIPVAVPQLQNVTFVNVFFSCQFSWVCILLHKTHFVYWNHIFAILVGETQTVFNSFFSFQFSHKLWAKTFALQRFLLFSIVFPLLFQWLWRQFSFFFLLRFVMSKLFDFWAFTTIYRVLERLRETNVRAP